VPTHLLRTHSATRSNKRTPQLRIRASAVVCARSPNQAARAKTGVSDVEKHPARLHSSFRSRRRGACCRSPRKGQAGRIREDLQRLRRRILLRSRNRYLHQDRRMGARRIHVPDRHRRSAVPHRRSRPQQPHRFQRVQHPGPLGDLDRRAHFDRIRDAARLQPRRFSDDDRRNCARQDLHRARIPSVRRVHLRQVAVLLRLLWRQVLLRLHLPGQLVHDRRERHATRRLLRLVRQWIHGHALAGRPVLPPRQRLGCLERRDQCARDRQRAWPRLRRQTRIKPAASTSAIRRQPVFRISSDRCASTRPGVRRRSPAPCTSSVPATTATTRPARARTSPA
jgi:hypothetical protein